MNIQTITNIELSSLCNNKCVYCPSPMLREKRRTGVGYMSMATYPQAINWVRKLALAGTQRELNLFGVGEPTLNPDVVRMVQIARDVLPMRIPIHLNTNGNTMTMELAEALKAAGITSIDVTDHEPKATAETIRIFKRLDIRYRVSRDAVLQPNNWAGQVDWFEPDYRYPCPWLERGQVMIMSDGSVTTCCLDAYGNGIVGTVNDDLTQVELRPFTLCKTCHHTINGVEAEMLKNG